MHIYNEKATNALSRANLQKTELKFLSHCAVAMETYNRDFKECHPRCVGELHKWEGSKNTTRILYKRCIF